MMFTQTQTTDLTITTWWQQIKKHHQIFFYLMAPDAPDLWSLENPEGFAHHLKRGSEQLKKSAYPTGTGRLQAHLLNAIHYLAESLMKPDLRSFECQVRLDVAKAEYSMVENELHAFGIESIS